MNMTKAEALQILAILKAAYPNSYKGMSKEDALATAAVWAMQFAELPVDIVTLAIHKAIASSPFPPAISEVKKKIEGIRWEAYEVVSELYGDTEYSKISAADKAKYKRIYELTRNYETCGSHAPTLADMLPMVAQPLLCPPDDGGGEGY